MNIIRLWQNLFKYIKKNIFKLELSFNTKNLLKFKIIVFFLLIEYMISNFIFEKNLRYLLIKYFK